MNRLERITALSQKDELSRREAMKEILRDAGLPFTLQEAPGSYENPSGIVNYMLDSFPEQPSLLFCAHYDAVPGSSGANDNAASICILIDLAQELMGHNVPVRFAFFDGEEIKQAGSKHYIGAVNKNLITGAVNLDLCGFGDTMTIYSRGKKPEAVPSLEPFMRKSIFESHHGQLVTYLPKSDDKVLSSAKIPTLSISVMPRSDVAFLKVLATYEHGFLGKPPEYDMIISQMEVSTTMHGGYRDDPKWLENEAMDGVYEYLLEAVMTTPEKRQKKSWFSIQY